MLMLPVYEYGENGNRTALHYANGFTTTYEYDLLNRLICEKIVDNRDNVVVQYTYTLGAAGERKSVTELDRTVEYSYDSLYRLTSETITEGEKVTGYTYAYDNVSNRILKTENGAATEYVYNALNQLVSDSETTYEYDLNGNLVRVIGTANSALYEYNTENKLVKAIVQNDILVTEESYTYDYQGNRTSKTTHRSDGVTEYVKYINDNSSLTNVLAEIGSEGSVQAYYTIGADLISQERDGNVSVYLYDGHGSVVGLANESGVVTDTYSYDAFGNLLKSTGSTKNCYRYCGEQFDETTGLYYLRARYMDTSTGRFISQDTYQGTINDPVSLHKYLYCRSNPVMNIDPSGYLTVEDLEVGTTGEAILDVSYQMSNQSAMRIGMKILAVAVTIFNIVLATYIITDVLLDNVSGIADGSTNSSDANDEARDSVIDNAIENTGTGSGGSNNDDDEWRKFVKQVKDLIEKYGVLTYEEFKKALKNAGFEIHHLIEKRFANLFKIGQEKIPSLPLPHTLHQVFTKLWRQAIAYSNASVELTTQSATKEVLIQAVKKIYRDFPEIVEILLEFIEKYSR